MPVTCYCGMCCWADTAEMWANVCAEPWRLGLLETSLELAVFDLGREERTNIQAAGFCTSWNSSLSGGKLGS